MWGNRDKEAPGPHSVMMGGSSPAPPHTGRRLLARSRQASSTEEGKCTAKGLPKPPALSHRGPGVRDRAEFRAEAEPAAIRLAWGEATVLQFLPALRARGFPSWRGFSPLSVSPPQPTLLLSMRLL